MEKGGGRQETVDNRQLTRDSSLETGDRRRETLNRIYEMEDKRWKGGGDDGNI